MGDNAQLVIVLAAVARAHIRAIGLLADAIVPYDSRTHEYPRPADFEKIIDDEGLGHNNVMGLVRG